MGRFLVLLIGVLGVAPASAGAPVSAEPDGLLVLGVVVRDDTGTVHRELAMVADPRTGETRARDLPGGALCRGPVMAVGDRVVFSGYRGRRAVALSHPLTLSGSPRSLGEADTITPSTTPGRVWLGRWRHGRKTSRAALREIEVGSNQVLSRTTEVLPRWTWLEAAMAGGFLVGHGRWLTFWEYPLDRPLRSIREASFVAADGSRFAWCGPRCRKLRVWSRDRERSFRPPPGVRLQGGGGALSPDGARIAVTVRVGAAQRLAVVDLASATWTVVRGVSPSGYGAITWSPSGRWLYVAAAGPRLLGWELGSARAVRLPVEPGGTVISIASAP